MNVDDKKTYYELVSLIKKQGQSRSKRHGEYIKLSIYDKYYLELDTWNNSIGVYDGEIFKGSLGIDFGGFNCNIVMTRFWLAHVPNIKINQVV